MLKRKFFCEDGNESQNSFKFTLFPSKYFKNLHTKIFAFYYFWETNCEKEFFFYYLIQQIR